MIVYSQTDPEAAKIVFECGAPIVMLPVELTHTALVTPDILNRISAELADNTPFLHLIKQLLLYFADSYRTVFKFDHPPLHDPCAVAYVIAPELFQVCLTMLSLTPPSPHPYLQTPPGLAHTMHLDEEHFIVSHAHERVLICSLLLAWLVQ